MNFHLKQWDSQFFSLRIGELNLHSLDTRKGFDLQQAIGDENCDCIYVTNADRVGLTNIPPGWIIRGPFKRQVFVKKLMTANETNGDVDEFNGTGAELHELSIESMHLSRFALDPGFRIHLKRYAEEWIRNSVVGEMADAIFVRRQARVVEGMVSVKLHSGYSQIGLIVVREMSRGYGYGKALLEAAENYAFHAGMEEMRISTQGENTGAVAFYSRSGYSLSSHQDIYHLWRT